jgi:pimeloyl-ACP methyl ester carboxylesterase
MKNKARLKLTDPARWIGFCLNALVRVSPRLAGRIAFTLFCLPRRKRPKPIESRFLATADLHFEDINDQRIAVYHWGFRGPIVLLAHGWESQAGRWRKFAPRLVEAGYQVMAVDAPAHGRSEGQTFTMIRYADVLRTLMQRLGPIDTIIAHSVGGAAAIWAMGTVGSANRPQKAVILASFSELSTIMNAAKWKVGAGPKLMEAIDLYLEKRTGAPTEYYSISRMASKLEDVNALLIHDEEDRVTHFGESIKIHQAWPYSKLWQTTGYGHGLTAPEVTDAAVRFVLEMAWAV